MTQHSPICQTAGMGVPFHFAAQAPCVVTYSGTEPALVP